MRSVRNTGPLAYEADWAFVPSKMARSFCCARAKPEIQRTSERTAKQIDFSTTEDADTAGIPD
jgi:hypothetical protein